MIETLQELLGYAVVALAVTILAFIGEVAHILWNRHTARRTR